MRAEAPKEAILQVNHPRSGRSGYFDAMKIQPGTLEAENQVGLSWDFDAIEVLNGKRQKDAMEVMEDWFAMLNRGGLFVATGNSDTHAVTGQEPRFGRSLVHVGFDDPRKLKPAKLIQVVRKERRVTVTTGPFVTMSLNKVPIGGFVAPKPGQGTLAVKVQAPGWIDVNRVEVVQAGKVIHTWKELSAKTDVIRLEETLNVPIDAPTWYIVRVFGEKSLEPVVPDPKAKPFAFTNPIWVGSTGEP